jgi:hypothetical protein
VNARLSKVDEAALIGDIDRVIGSFQKNMPTLVYHYTSLDAFASIVKSNCLRLSNILYSNDYLENEHGVRLIHEHLDKMASTGKKEVQSMLSLYKAAMSTFLKTTIRYYVISFSEAGNSLSQWRGYCSNGGVSLGFSARQLIKLNANRKNQQPLSFMKVLYDRKQQLAWLDEIWKAIFSYDSKAVLPDGNSIYGSSLFGKRPLNPTLRAAFR